MIGTNQSHVSVKSKVKGAGGKEIFKILHIGKKRNEKHVTFCSIYCYHLGFCIDIISIHSMEGNAGASELR